MRGAQTAAGLDQKALAAKIGVSVASVSRWECDKHPPSAEHLFRLAAALHVDPEWLLRGGPPATSVEHGADHAAVAAAVEHVRAELERALASATPQRKAEILRHIKTQVSLIADLAATMESAGERRGSLRRTSGR